MTMMFDLLVKNGTIVSAAGQTVASLGIKDGKIVFQMAGDCDLPARVTYDATGKYVMPGAVDPHVHAGHGDPDRETLWNASAACAAGGITTMIDQPLSNPSTVTLQAVQDKITAMGEQCVIDYAVWGGLVPGHVDDLEGMFSAGAQAFKSFMCRCSNYPMTDDGTLVKGMRIIGKLGGLVGVHAENDTLIAQLVQDYASAGKRDVEAFIASHPAYTELEAIQRFIFLAGLAPECKAHVVHMSLPEGAEMVARARSRGLNVTVETCPQYLGLTEDDLRQIGGIAKCDPPVRSQEVVDRLWDKVIDGSIDILASDHSPHPSERKIVPPDRFDMAGEGVSGLQTMIPVAVEEGVAKRSMSLSRLAEISSLNPATRFGLYPRKGHLSPGADADFYILDMSRSWTCHAKDMHYLIKHTPFDGRRFRGVIEKTFVRGTLVSDGSAIKVQNGFGRFHRMEMC